MASMAHALLVTTAAQLDEDDPLPVDFRHIDEAQDLSELPRQYAANQKAGQDHTQGPKATLLVSGTLLHAFLSLQDVCFPKEETEVLSDFLKARVQTL